MLLEISDYGQLYAYGGFPDFAMWDGRLEGKQTDDIVLPPETALPLPIPELDEDIKVRLTMPSLAKSVRFVWRGEY